MRGDDASICTAFPLWTIRLGALIMIVGAGSVRAAAQDFLVSQIAINFANDPLIFSGMFAAMAVFFWAYFVIRKLTREEQAAEKRARELEAALNESEAILTAEPTILVIWHGRDGQPTRIAGDMKGVVKIPADKAALLDLPSWLDPESAHAVLQVNIGSKSSTALGCVCFVSNSTTALGAAVGMGRSHASQKMRGRAARGRNSRVSWSHSGRLHHFAPQAPGG